MRRPAVLAVPLVGLLVVSGCKPIGTGESNAVGTVASVAVADDVVSLSFIPDAGYEYYSGTIFDVGPEVGVWDADWGTMAATDISAGATIEVWAAVCAESYPVQCDVTGVRVLD